MRRGENAHPVPTAASPRNDLCSISPEFLRQAGLRHFGLALFALTLLKVTFIDLRKAAMGYRILSFIGLGGLLLGTSVLYGKLTPRLLRDDTADGHKLAA